MTNKEMELVGYLRQSHASNENMILIEKNILEKSISFLFENEIRIMSLSALNVLADKVLKIEGSSKDYSKKQVSVEEIMSDIEKLSENVTHYELFLKLKK